MAVGLGALVPIATGQVLGEYVPNARERPHRAGLPGGRGHQRGRRRRSCCCRTSRSCGWRAGSRRPSNRPSGTGCCGCPRRSSPSAPPASWPARPWASAPSGACCPASARSPSSRAPSARSTSSCCCATACPLALAAIGMLVVIAAVFLGLGPVAAALAAPAGRAQQQAQQPGVPDPARAAEAAGRRGGELRVRGLGAGVRAQPRTPAAGRPDQEPDHGRSTRSICRSARCCMFMLLAGPGPRHAVGRRRSSPSTPP